MSILSFKNQFLQICLMLQLLIIPSAFSADIRQFYLPDMGKMIQLTDRWFIADLDQNAKIYLSISDVNDIEIPVDNRFYQQQKQMIKILEYGIRFEKMNHFLYAKKIVTYQLSYQKDFSNGQKVTIQLFSSDLNSVQKQKDRFLQLIHQFQSQRMPASVVSEMKSRVGEMICENGLLQNQIRGLLQQGEELLQAGCQSYAKQNGLQILSNTMLGCLKGGGSLVKDVVQLAYELINFLYKSSLSSKYQNQISEKFGDLLKLAAAHPKEFFEQVYNQIVDLVSREMESIAHCGPEYHARMACKIIFSIISGHFLFKSATAATIAADETAKLADVGARYATKSESTVSSQAWYRSRYRSAAEVPGYQKMKSEVSDQLKKLFKSEDPKEKLVREQLFRTNYLSRIKDPQIRETTESVFKKMNDSEKFSSYIDQLVDDAAQEMYLAKDIRKLQKLENGEIEPWAYAKVLMKRATANGQQVSGVKKYDLEEFFRAVEKGPFIDLANKNNLHGVFTHLMQQDYVSDVVKLGMKGRQQDYYQSLVRQNGARLWDTMFDATELSISGKTPMTPEWLNREVLVNILKFQKITK